MLRATANALRRVSASHAAPSRTLAIAATVKTAPDTSAIDFPAPSHVSLPGEAFELLRQLRAFYEAPDSSVHIPAELKEEVKAELIARISGLPDSSLTPEQIEEMAKVPDTIRLGDNPMFKVFEAERKANKLA